MLIKLQNAYDTISDPEKRRAYDTRLSGIRDGLRAQQEAERRQATAAETERKGATEETAKEQREDDARQEHLRHLELLRDISELRPVVNKLAADLRSLYDQDAEDSRKERERNSWWAYLASHIYGKVKKTDEQKQAQETERLHRIASKSIKVSELREKEAKLQGLQAAARTRAEQEKRERWAKAKKEQAEHAAKEAREAQAARETREAQEPVWKAAAAERHKRDAEERAQEMRAAEEAARKVQKAQNEWSKPATPLYSSSRASGSTKRTCRHDKFWPRRHLYSNCHTVQKRFVFQCPDCRMIARADRRPTLRGKISYCHRLLRACYHGFNV